MSNKLKKNEYDDEMSFSEFIIGVFAVIGFIFFLGELFSDSETKEPVKILPEDKLKSKRQRLEEVNNKLNELRPQKAELKRIEKIIYKWSRAVIAMGFIVTNIVVLVINNWTFNLGTHLNVNGAIVTIYGFFAFIIYGSPSELVKAIKEKTANYLKKKHIHTLTELKELEQEHRTLLKEISDLETNIIENTNTIKQISNA
ncbi:hypothetical protein ACS386_10240 [Flavobacteriaceae bacterium LMO-SS05]